MVKEYYYTALILTVEAKKLQLARTNRSSPENDSTKITRLATRRFGLRKA